MAKKIEEEFTKIVDLREDKSTPIDNKEATRVEIYIEENGDVKIKAPTEWIPVHVAEALATEVAKSVKEGVEKSWNDALDKDIKKFEKQRDELVRRLEYLKNEPGHAIFWRWVCIIQSIIFILVLLKVGGII